MDERRRDNDDIAPQLREALTDYALARVVCCGSRRRCAAGSASLRLGERLGAAFGH